MRVIYLLSGPDQKKGFSKEIKKFLIKDLAGKKQITFIASSPDDFIKNDLYINGNGNDILGIKNHLKKVVNLSEFNILDNRIDLETGKQIILNSEIIYLLGGNPFTQIEYIKKNGYDTLLKNFKGIIIGTSAGAMNLSKKSYYSKDQNYDKSFFYKGIGLTDIIVDPHFNLEDKIQLEEIKKFSKKSKIIGLPNESAIRIINSEIIYINKSFAFDNGIMEEKNDYEKE